MEFFSCFVWTPKSRQISTWQRGWFSGALNEILFSEVCRACTPTGPRREFSPLGEISRNSEAFLACPLHVLFLASIISRKICLSNSLLSMECKDICDSLNLFCSLSVTYLRHLLTYYRLKWDMISTMLGVKISLWIFWVLGVLLLQRTEINALGSLFQACAFIFHLPFIKCKTQVTWMRLNITRLLKLYYSYTWTSKF